MKIFLNSMFCNHQQVFKSSYFYLVVFILLYCYSQLVVIIWVWVFNFMPLVTYAIGFSVFVNWNLFNNMNFFNFSNIFFLSIWIFSVKSGLQRYDHNIGKLPKMNMKSNLISYIRRHKEHALFQPYLGTSSALKLARD